MAFKGALVIDTEKYKRCGVCITGCPNNCIALAKQVNKKGYNYLEMINGRYRLVVQLFVLTALSPFIKLRLYQRKINQF